MSTAISAHAVGKRYGREWVLSETTLEIPAGRVAGIIGPNGSGKSTLMQLAVGLLDADAGAMEILGEELVPTAEQSARIGFLPQKISLYPSFSVAEHLRFGAVMNPAWDMTLADQLIARLGLRRSQRAGRMSGGQQAQLALVLAVAKRPEVLVLDEPVANLDPLARRECLQILMEYAAETGATVALSSHLVTDVERICDYVILLAGGTVQLCGEVDELLATPRRLTGPRRYGVRMPGDQQVIEEVHTDRQSTLLIRGEEPVLDPAWTVQEVGLEDIALAYMRVARGTAVTELRR